MENLECMGLSSNNYNLRRKQAGPDGAHFNPRTREAFMRSKSAWSTQQVPVQLGVEETWSKKSKREKKKVNVPHFFLLIQYKLFTDVIYTLSGNKNECFIVQLDPRMEI